MILNNPLRSSDRSRRIWGVPGMPRYQTCAVVVGVIIVRGNARKRYGIPSVHAINLGIYMRVIIGYLYYIDVIYNGLDAIYKTCWCYVKRAWCHCNDVTLAPCKSPPSRLFVDGFVWVKKENIKAPHHWPIVRENVSISLRHYFFCYPRRRHH